MWLVCIFGGVEEAFWVLLKALTKQSTGDRQEKKKQWSLYKVYRKQQLHTIIQEIVDLLCLICAAFSCRLLNFQSRPASICSSPFVCSRHCRPNFATVLSCSISFSGTVRNTDVVAILLLLVVHGVELLKFLATFDRVCKKPSAVPARLLVVLAGAYHLLQLGTRCL